MNVVFISCFVGPKGTCAKPSFYYALMQTFILTLETVPLLREPSQFNWNKCSTMISLVITPRRCSKIEYLLFQLNSEKSVTNRLTMQSDFKGGFGLFLSVKRIEHKNGVYGRIHRANHRTAHVHIEKARRSY